MRLAVPARVRLTSASLALAPQPARVRLTSATLALASLSMVVWDRAPVPGQPIATFGRLLLAVALVALVIELRPSRATWALARRALHGPAAALVAGGALSLTLVGVSVSTNGCQCSGGSYGLLEMATWTALVLIAVLAEPRRSSLLLATAVVGAVIVGLVALIAVNSPPTGLAKALSNRLTGTYGNPNFLAATQALGFPASVAAAMALRRQVVRALGLTAAGLLGVVLVLSYSRGGLLAAATGAYAVIVWRVPKRRRLAVALTLPALSAAAWVILYPAFQRQRTAADFPAATAAANAVDKSGWDASQTGLLPAGPSRLTNIDPDTLRVTASQPGQGTSHSLGGAGPPMQYHLRFQARSLESGLRLSFGMEDNLVAAGSQSLAAYQSRRWRSFALNWRPSRVSSHARAYFWADSAGSFDLRRLTISMGNLRNARALPVRLLGPNKGIDPELSKAEADFVRAREGALRIAIHAFLTHPLRGIGWERFPAYASSRSGVGAIATHDEYTRFAAELGAPGLVAFALLCVGAAWGAVCVRGHQLGAALIGMIVAGGVSLMFANLLESPQAGLSLATAVSTAVALGTVERSAREKPDG